MKPKGARSTVLLLFTLVLISVGCGYLGCPPMFVFMKRRASTLPAWKRNCR